VTDEPVDIDTSVPQAARRYDYLLGGKDNFAADRKSAEELRKAFPAIGIAARENRRFLRRAVHYLAADRGIRQFIDIGVGIPAAPNVHEIAQAVDPAARVVYVDNDPVVAAHARALLTGSRPGVRVFLTGDLRRPADILESPLTLGTLQADRPIGLLLIAVLPFVDDDHAYGSVRRLCAGLPPGSHVAISHVTYDPLPDPVAARLRALSTRDPGHGSFRARTRAEVDRFLDGLEVLPPGLVSVVEWMPDRDPPAEATPIDVASYAAVARVP
jgi:hypothetical protein